MRFAKFLYPLSLILLIGYHLITEEFLEQNYIRHSILAVFVMALAVELGIAKDTGDYSVYLYPVTAAFFISIMLSYEGGLIKVRDLIAWRMLILVGLGIFDVKCTRKRFSGNR